MRKLRTILILLLLAVTGSRVAAQSTAHVRAERLGLGMNLTHLDNWWLGTKKNGYSDFLKPKEAAKREKMFADIAAAGFKTVRIPINFGAWATLNTPYSWRNIDGLKTAEQFVDWALANGLNVIIDLHHVEFDRSIAGADSTERIVWLWREMATRYKRHSPERVFFELRNEPHDIKADDWRRQAEEIIQAVRKIAPDHTLIIGFHDWNSRQAMIDSKPFSDPNVIYTFHYYDPFIFTHQGATWSAKGLAELKGVSFPADGREVKIPNAAKGTWVEGQIKSYHTDSQPTKMYSDLKAAKDWSVKNNVPIFLGEFGSYSKHPALEDRCRHAAVVYSALGELNIPNAWWEWNDSFSMFDKGTTSIAGCMRQAIEQFHKKRLERSSAGL